MVLGLTALFSAWTHKCEQSLNCSPMFFPSSLFHTSNRHQITGAEVFGRDVAALLNSLSLVPVRAQNFTQFATQINQWETVIFPPDVDERKEELCLCSWHIWLYEK